MPAKSVRLYDLKVSEQARKRVNSVLRSGWLTTGNVCTQLERAVSRQLGIPHCLAVSSATHGLEIALSALNVGIGDEVITTAFSFVATTEVILRRGAMPVFVDIEPQTLNLDPARIERAITSRTKCILAVDIAGLPCDYRKLRELAKKHKLSLLADSSHAFGALRQGTTSAAFADISVYSLHATKNLTSGEGGLVVTRNRKMAGTLRLLSRHGMTSNSFERRKKQDWAYDVRALGFKANLSDIHAAVGLGQLSVFWQQQMAREKIAVRYTRELQNVTGLMLPAAPKNVRHAWHLFIIRLARSSVSRRPFIARMQRAGIECGIHYQAINTLSWYKSRPYSKVSLPITESASQSVVSLPMHPFLTISEVAFVCNHVKKCLEP